MIRCCHNRNSWADSQFCCSVLMISCCHKRNSWSDSQSAVLSWWSAVATTGTTDPTANSAVLFWWSAVATTGTTDPTANQLFCPDYQMLPQKKQPILKPISCSVLMISCCHKINADLTAKQQFCPNDQLLPQKEQLILQPISFSVLMISCCHNRNSWANSQSEDSDCNTTTAGEPWTWWVYFKNNNFLFVCSNTKIVEQMCVINCFIFLSSPKVL